MKKKRNVLKKLEEEIGRVPRVNLAFLPTPLQEMHRLSEALGGPRIFIKRDDLTGLAFGGNKSRMFEFVLAKAKQNGADSVIAGASIQSNYCRQLTAACNYLGFETYLVLNQNPTERLDRIQGNLLLNCLAGAHITIVQVSDEEQRELMIRKSVELRKAGKNPYVLRIASEENLAADVIAYVNCYCEILEQTDRLGIFPKRLYVASTSTTQAGLVLGRALVGNDIEIVGVAAESIAGSIENNVAKYANQAAYELRVDTVVAPEDVVNLGEFIGDGYGIPTKRGMQMLETVAQTEGVFLDPVYTSKAFSAIYDHIQKGYLDKSDTIIFLHTGGTPLLFAYDKELCKYFNFDELLKKN